MLWPRSPNPDTFSYSIGLPALPYFPLRKFPHHLPTYRVRKPGPLSLFLRCRSRLQGSILGPTMSATELRKSIGNCSTNTIGTGTMTGSFRPVCRVRGYFRASMGAANGAELLLIRKHRFYM